MLEWERKIQWDAFRAMMSRPCVVCGRLVAVETRRFDMDFTTEVRFGCHGMVEVVRVSDMDFMNSEATIEYFRNYRPFRGEVLQNFRRKPTYYAIENNEGVVDGWVITDEKNYPWEVEEVPLPPPPPPEHNCAIPPPKPRIIDLED